MSKKKNEFRPNDFVVYPAHGVGQIVSIEEQEIAGIDLELFVISFEKDKMTLRVPTHKATAIGMRGLSSPDVISQAMKTLKGKAKVKRAMWSRRAQEYEQKINSGDLIAIAEVVRDLERKTKEGIAGTKTVGQGAGESGATGEGAVGREETQKRAVGAEEA